MNENEIKAFYTYLQSQQTAQNFLMNCYQNENEAEIKSYENCNSFMYYIKHGLHFYKTGKKTNIIAQPILFFYGLIHLLKATLLTKRPNYPETTKLLAHGVSSRKRKKKQYSFMNDEVRIQYQGLFPYFSKHLFAIDKFPFEKIKMKNLFALIPEMNTFFNFREEKKMIPIGMIGEEKLSFPMNILDDYHLTENAFLQRIRPFIPDVHSIHSDLKYIHIELTTPILNTTSPFFLHIENNKIYFPMSREHFFSISEVMVHYLLLYNLSMISRYETEWWGDLITNTPDIDYPLIVHFLKVTSEKMPFFLGQELYHLHCQ